MSGFPSVRKFQPEMLTELQAASRDDNHYLIAPTHVIQKDGKIVGYWSVNGMPHVHLWHSSKALGARDSLVLRELLDANISDMGHSRYIAYCADQSPYYSHIEKLGFKQAFSTNLLLREIN